MSGLVDRISRYAVIEEVGRGGMGRVLRAYDPKLQREVAIKEVRGERLDREMAQRLVVEARAMAKLSHPNVVSVFDVEELDGGRVVLIMEYVAGQTMQQWLCGEERPWPEVVALFSEAGEGLAAAHEAGLLHRDFKPANVLLTSEQHAKVTDFGLAKAHGSLGPTSEAEHESRDDGLTEHGVIVGTPRYMAPEQHGEGELSAAADQFAFCVALWEGLVGEPPYVGKSEGLVRMKLAGPPDWPASRVPSPIVHALRRGLSPDPSQRWPTMRELLDALQWSPHSSRVRPLLAIAGAGVVAVGAIVWASAVDDGPAPCSGGPEHLAGVWDEQRAESVRASFDEVGHAYADRVVGRTIEALDDYAVRWVETYEDACAATTIRGERSQAMLDQSMACLRAAIMELEATVEQLETVDDDVVQKAHRLTEALPLLSHCTDPEALATAVAPPPESEAKRVEEARAELAVAKAETRAGRYVAARTRLDRVGESLEGIDYPPVRIEFALESGANFDDLGRAQEAESVLTEGIRLALRTRDLEHVQDAATQLLFIVGRDRDRLEEGRQYGMLAWELAGDDELEQASVANNLGIMLKHNQRYEQAIEQHRKALEIRLRRLGPEHARVGMSRVNLANTLYFVDVEAAEAEHRRAVATMEAAHGPDHPLLATALNNLTQTLLKAGKHDEGLAAVRRGLEIRQESLNPDHPSIVDSLENLAAALALAGRLEEAVPAFERALEAARRVRGSDHAKTLRVHRMFVQSLADTGDLKRAISQGDALLRALVRADGEASANATVVRTMLAEINLEAGQPDEAERLAGDAWNRVKVAGEPPQRVRVGFILARSIAAGSDPARMAEAETLATDALALAETLEAPQVELVEQIRRWLEDPGSRGRRADRGTER